MVKTVTVEGGSRCGGIFAAAAALLAMFLTASGRWASDWRLSGKGGEERLVLEGTTFDAAIRKALFGVVAVLVER